MCVCVCACVCACVCERESEIERAREGDIVGENLSSSHGRVRRESVECVGYRGTRECDNEVERVWEIEEIARL